MLRRSTAIHWIATHMARIRLPFNLLGCLLGGLVTEKLIVPASSRATASLLAYLCARDEGGFYCSTIPFATRLTNLVVRACAYAFVAAHYSALNLKNVLSGVGVGGLVVGWALNKVLQDAVSGALIVATQPFRVGDFITLRTDSMNFDGRVDRITLSHIVLAEGSGPGDDDGGGGWGGVGGDGGGGCGCGWYHGAGAESRGTKSGYPYQSSPRTHLEPGQRQR